MRSQMSRGVPEWSGGEDLYIGSQVSAIGKVSGVISIVPGPPKGSRGSTGWGHLSRRAPWAEVGGEPAPSGLVRPPPGPPLRLGLGTLGEGRLHLPWGARHPLGRPPWRFNILGPAPPWGPYIKRGEGGQPHPCTWCLPSPFSTPLPPADAWRSPAGIPAASTTTPSCCWISINLSFPLAGSRRRRRHPLRTCVERGGAVCSALGHR